MLIDCTAGYFLKKAALSVLLFAFDRFLGLLVISRTLHYICSISGYIKTVAVFWCCLFNRLLGLWVIKRQLLCFVVVCLTGFLDCWLCQRHYTICSISGYRKTVAVSVLLFNRFLGLLVISETLHYM